jgi:hypothetical protein
VARRWAAVGPLHTRKLGRGSTDREEHVVVARDGHVCELGPLSVLVEGREYKVSYSEGRWRVYVR